MYGLMNPQECIQFFKGEVKGDSCIVTINGTTLSIPLDGKETGGTYESEVRPLTGIPSGLANFYLEGWRRFLGAINFNPSGLFGGGGGPGGKPLLKCKGRPTAKSQEFDNAALALDIGALGVDGIRAGVVTATATGATIFGPAGAATGYGAGSIATAPLNYISNGLSSAATLYSIRADMERGAGLERGSVNSLVLTAVGWINPEPYSGFLLQGLVVSNDAGTTNDLPLALLMDCEE
jgi:hypothetical protein